MVKFAENCLTTLHLQHVAGGPGTCCPVRYPLATTGRILPGRLRGTVQTCAPSYVRPSTFIYTFIVTCATRAFVYHGNVVPGANDVHLADSLRSIMPISSVISRTLVVGAVVDSPHVTDGQANETIR